MQFWKDSATAFVERRRPGVQERRVQSENLLGRVFAFGMHIKCSKDGSAFSLSFQTSTSKRRIVSGVFCLLKRAEASCLCFGGAFRLLSRLGKIVCLSSIRLALHASKDFWKTETEHVLVRPEKPEKRRHHYWANIRCYWGQKKGPRKQVNVLPGFFELFCNGSN